MALERLAPDSIAAISNWTGALSDIQDDPDSPTGTTWLTSPALQASAAKTFYMMGGTLLNGMQPLQENGAAPADAAFATATGWIVGNGASNTYAGFRANTERAANQFAATVQPDNEGLITGATGNAFRSPSAYTGSFAAGNWIISAILRSVTASLPTGTTLSLRWRVYASANAAGTTARELTSTPQETAAVAGNGGTTANHAARTVTWAAPAITLNNEYLFFVCALRIVVASGSGTTRDANFRQNSGSAITTPAFAPAEPVQSIRLTFPSPSNPLTAGAGLQEIKTWSRKKGTGPDPSLFCQIYENGVFVENATPDTGYTVASTTGELESYTWDATGNTAANIEALLTTSGGTVGGANIELGAVEWNATTTVVQALTRSANTYVAAVTSGATRTYAFQRAANSFVADITAIANRLGTGKVRSANTYMEAVTTAANMTRGMFRTANSFVADISAQAARVTSGVRGAVSYTDTVTGASSRLATLARTANSYTDNITAIANWSRAIARSANSHVNAIVSDAGRTANLSREAQAYVEVVSSLAQRAWNLHMTANSHVADITSSVSQFTTKVRNSVTYVADISGQSTRIAQIVRNVQSSVAELTSSATRLQNSVRVVISHVAGLSASGTRNTTAYRLANSFVQEIDAYSTQQVITYLLRSATSYVSAITSSSNRSAQDFTRTMLSGVQDLGASANRTTTLFKTAQTYVEQITAYSDSAKSVLRSAESAVDTISTFANRVSSLWRKQEESVGEITGGSSAVSTKVRTAVSHVEAITSRTNNTSIPKVRPGGITVELTRKVGIVAGTLRKVEMLARTAEKPHMTVDLKTD